MPFVIQSDASLFGILMALLGVIFYTTQIKNVFFKRFYPIFPAILLCYFIPYLLNTFSLVDVSQSDLYFVASRYLLPAAIVLLTLSVNFKSIIQLGPKLIVMFLVGAFGIAIGGPIALLLVCSLSPDLLNTTGHDAVWRGMTTIAGSWIGANQTTMKEIYDVGDRIFSATIAVDVIVANIWLAILLILTNHKIKFWRVSSNDHQANIGGVACAPIVASVFHPSLAPPVGVL